MMILAACLARDGRQGFLRQAVSWRGTALYSGTKFAGPVVFIVGTTSTARAGGIDLSLAQCLLGSFFCPFALT